MSRVRVVFLGTPPFAVVSLKALLEDEHFEVVGVVTQPDRPSGRNLKLTPSPVKQLALEKNLPVLSPEKINQSLDDISAWKADVAVVVAFGQILSQKFLELFPFGAVNIHGSLLPKWRGAAPIQRSIEAGDTETGVCLQKIVRELDAGDVFGMRRVDVDPDESALQLHDRLAVLGVELLRVELMDYVRGNLAPTPQDASLVTYAKKIEKQECAINWQKSALEIHNKVRAFQMGPGTYSFLDNKRVKIHRTKIVEGDARASAPSARAEASARGEFPVGSCLEVTSSRLRVSCGQGVIDLIELQPEGKPRMPVELFLKSFPVRVGQVFQGENPS